jgi:dTDP-4-dehydrorhamnose reductase
MEFSVAAKKTILVTGANGQLGNEVQVVSPAYDAYDFLFVTRDTLAIDDFKAVENYFRNHRIDFCINCAAYTAVDKAEIETEKALLINGAAVGNLASICKAHNTQFIHISTDYVFDGTATVAYKEDHQVSPVNRYGATKLTGEELAQENNPGTIIIRTSWVYSIFGNNFVKTMLRLMKEKEQLNVVSDQQGCPTYAADLAAAIMQIIISGKAADNPGIYNYSNEGSINWYQFAVAIKELSLSKCNITPIPSSNYPTPAKRPAYSVLDTTKIRRTFNINIPNWKASLQQCISLMEL